jgi:hypothetical protein
MDEHISGEDWTRSAMEQGRPGQAQPIPSRQIDPGLYTVLNIVAGGDRREVGMVFVEGEGSIKIEHYVVSDEHRSPGAARGMLIEDHAESVASLAEFFALMRQRMAGRKVTYIKSTCEYFDYIPEL